MYLDHNDNDEVSPAILWDALKAEIRLEIRGKIISISSQPKKKKKQSAKAPAFTINC